MRESFGAKDVKNVKNVSKLRKLVRNGSGIMIVYSTRRILPIMVYTWRLRPEEVLFSGLRDFTSLSIKRLENLAFPHVKRLKRAYRRICDS